MSNLRMNLHSKNINLNKILAKLGEKLDQDSFFNLMKFIYKEMTSEEIGELFKFLVNKENCISIKDFIKFLTLHQCRLTGMDYNKN